MIPQGRPVDNVWDAAYEAGQAAYGPLDLARAEVETQVRAHLVRRLEPLGLAPLEATLDDLLTRCATADLVLAVAVEAGLPHAATRVRERVAPALLELARKRGVVSGLAARYVDTGIEQALAAPASGPGRTALGAYDGSASLRTWLALGLEERIQEAARQPAPGEPEPPPLPPVVPSEHPSANLLAGLAEGRLLPGEAEAVVTHAMACSRCRDLLHGLELAAVRPAELAPSTDDPSGEAPLVRGRGRPPRPRRRLGGLLLALLVLLGIVWLAAAQGGPSLFERMGLGQDTERDVFEATQRLHQAEPGMFAEFAPYTRRELEQGTAPPNVEQEGPRAVHPRERVLSGHPTFQWKGVADATRYTLLILDEAGAVLWSGAVTGTTQAWPPGLAPLQPGTTAAWDLAAEGAGAQALRTNFSIAPERDTLHWERRLKRLAELVPDLAAREVLTAQIALRRGHLWEAWEAARAHTQRVPTDRYGDALEGYLRRVHGLHD